MSTAPIDDKHQYLGTVEHQLNCWPGPRGHHGNTGNLVDHLLHLLERRTPGIHEFLKDLIETNDDINVVRYDSFIWPIRLSIHLAHDDGPPFVTSLLVLFIPAPRLLILNLREKVPQPDVIARVGVVVVVSRSLAVLDNCQVEPRESEKL